MSPTSTAANFAKLSIFFPMWNEQDYIRRTIGFATETCEVLVADGEIGDYELVIVEDASTDDTGAIADALAAEDLPVHVVQHETNRKLGGSIKTGLAACTGDIVLYTDADLPFDMAELSARADRALRGGARSGRATARQGDGHGRRLEGAVEHRAGDLGGQGAAHHRGPRVRFRAHGHDGAVAARSGPARDHGPLGPRLPSPAYAPAGRPVN